MSDSANKRQWFRLLLPVFLIGLMFAAEVHTSTAGTDRPFEQPTSGRSGLRGIRNRGGQTPNQARPVESQPPPSDDGIGTLSQGLGSCSAGIFNSNGTVSELGFIPNSWVLGIAPAGDNHISFWVQSDASGRVYIDDFADLYAAGGDPSKLMLVGENGGWGKFAGYCSNRVSQEKSQQQLFAEYGYDEFINSLPPVIGSFEVCETCTAAILDAASIGNTFSAPDSVYADPEMLRAIITVSQGSNTPTGIVEQTSLTSGQFVNGALTTTDGDAWYVYANTDEVVTLDLNSSDFDAYLQVYDPNGSLLIENDDVYSGNLNSQVVFAAPYTGSYRVIARALDSSPSGSYNLNVNIAAPVSYALDLYAGEGRDSTIMSEFGELWMYYGYAGKTITITMFSDQVDSYLMLLDANGNWLAQDDDSGGGLNARIVAQLPAEGMYTILATTYAGGGRGDYSISLEVGSVPTAVPLIAFDCPGAPAPRLMVGSYGRVLPGTPNRIRSQPTTNSSQIGVINGGESFYVLEGPQCGNGFVWWYVDYNDTQGWTAEGQGGSYWLEPVG
jgi:hypothetical protein